MTATDTNLYPLHPLIARVERQLSRVVRGHLAAGRTVTLSPAAGGGVTISVGDDLAGRLRQVLREELREHALAAPRPATAAELAQLPPEAMLAAPASALSGPVETQSMYTTKEVMARLRYTQRGAFWEFVRREGVPHIRLRGRVIRFPSAALEEWLRKRSSTG